MQLRVQAEFLVIMISQLSEFRKKFIGINKTMPEKSPIFLDLSLPLEKLRDLMSNIQKNVPLAPIYVQNIHLNKLKQASTILEKLTCLSEYSENIIITVDYIELVEYFLEAEVLKTKKQLNSLLQLKDQCYHFIVIDQLKDAGDYSRYNNVFWRFNVFFSLKPRRFRNIGLLIPNFENLDQVSKVWDIVYFSKELLRLQHDHEYIHEIDVLEPDFVQKSNIKTLFVLPFTHIPAGLVEQLRKFSESGRRVIFIHPGSNKKLSFLVEYSELLNAFFRNMMKNRVRSISLDAGKKGKLILTSIKKSSPIKFEILLERLLDKFHDPPFKINSLIIEKRNFKFYSFKIDNTDFFLVINGLNEQKYLNINLKGKGRIMKWDFINGVVEECYASACLDSYLTISKEFLPQQVHMFELV